MFNRERQMKMEKSVIRNFAVEARKMLIKSAVTEAGSYGVTEETCSEPKQKGQNFEVYETLAGTEHRIFGEDIRRRAELAKAVQERGFQQVIEETAYTWFNRIIAVRFMEVNDYLPTRVRVLSSETGSYTPDLVMQAFDVDLNMTPEEIVRIQEAKENNRYDEAFCLLFIKQCNELNTILPGLFEKTDDYMELLLRLSYTSDGVVRMLIDTIPEADFDVKREGQVEIIGWLYQSYISELSDMVYDGTFSKEKVSKELLGPATQLFTPDWPIRYMVENALCRNFVSQYECLESWKYYLPNTSLDGPSEFELSKMKFIDPCMGSGHILVYAFDVFLQMYEYLGYNRREAAKWIIERNLYGLDIDDRACQLAYFAVMMKGRQYNRKIFSEVKTIHLFSLRESGDIDPKVLFQMGACFPAGEREQLRQELSELLELFQDAKELGSVLKLTNFSGTASCSTESSREGKAGKTGGRRLTAISWEKLHQYVDSPQEGRQSLFSLEELEKVGEKMHQILNAAEVLAGTYDAVVTNPPYLGRGRFDDCLLGYADIHYPEVKYDLSMIMYQKAMQDLVKKNAYAAFITTSTWMTIKKFEKLRAELIRNYDLVNLVDFGTELFDGKVGHNPIVAWVTKNSKTPAAQSTAIRLVDYCYARRGEKRSQFFNKENRYSFCAEQFLNIQSTPLSYWIQESILDAFQRGESITRYFRAIVKGIFTGDNKRFLRAWFEVEPSALDKKWKYYSKGGPYRKWYGNVEYVVNWENEAAALRGFPGSGLGAAKYFGKKTIVWTKVSSYKTGFRLNDANVYFDDASPALVFDHTEDRYYFLAFLNSCVSEYMLRFLAPTVNYQCGDIKKLPILFSSEYEEELCELARENVRLAKEDWDLLETSYHYKYPLLLKYRACGRIEEALGRAHSERQRRDAWMKQNEERINELFLRIYHAEEILSSNVDGKDITLTQRDARGEILDLISYYVGCLLGRYRPEFEFEQDRDGILLVTDEAYFQDDIVSKFVEFVEAAFGAEHLNDNLETIAEWLGGRAELPLEKIRLYFLNQFYADHCSRYTVTNGGKRPIYWLFDSGEQNAFKVLISMHRYHKDTVGLVRSDYLHRVQDAVETALKNAEYVIAHSDSTIDQATAVKARDKYIRQLSEMKIYYQAISHVALQRLELNLDDGVRVNYEKFQGVLVSGEGTKRQTVDLLAKL